MKDQERLIYLERRIEVLRKQMIDVASEQGYTSSESVRLSQELDSLINEYLKLDPQSRKQIID
ncbi:stage 0 sporulation regulatory protein [Alkalibacillus filiformis]|uniref:Stage 0 sporulation regulatory protein n=1 Tax=Alkalibacillus filiformis TaxID=200990 RepID=A0ABU0DQ36_9BACI|nr:MULTISPECIES: aspartyl-phosphate phosphatase Spo0E family protein [Alkalibacillus]MDQ0350428.1 stage 0 sporulation regulatory protein [Alkalibacillus filiformis]